MNPPSTDPHQGCCADVYNAPSAALSASESPKAFGAFLQSVQAAGTLPEKTKELLLFSLVVMSRCAPCFDAHYQKALSLGLTPAELDEAAWCAIAIGGAPVRMFYEESLKRVRR